MTNVYVILAVNEPRPPKHSYRPRLRLDDFTIFPFESITPPVVPSAASKAALVASSSAPAMYTGFLWP